MFPCEIVLYHLPPKYESGAKKVVMVMTPIRTFFSLSKAIRLKSFLKANDVLRLSEEQWVKGGETWLPDP